MRRFVEVPGVDVGHHVVVHAGRVFVDQARGVERLHLVVGVRNTALRLGPVFRATLPIARGAKSPRLVEQRPLVDGRMVEVALHHPLETVPVFGEHLVAHRAPGVRHVRLDEETQLVRPVQLARHFGLHVYAVASQRQPLREEDVVLHELVRRERIIALRMEGLVETQLQVDGLAVQRHVGVAVRVFACSDLTEAEVGLHGVVAQRERDVVEVGIVEIPQLGRSDGNVNGLRNLALRKRHLRGLFVQLHLCDERSTRRRGEPQLGFHGGLRDARREARAVEIVLSARLEIDGLPDATHVAVALLADEVVSDESREEIGIPDFELGRLFLAPLNEIRQLELERHVAADVLAKVLAIE